MNRRLIVRLQGATLMLEAVLMLPALFVSLYYRDGTAAAFAKSAGILLVLGFPLWFFAKPSGRNLHAREGLVSVAISWILLSLFGALPYLFSGVIPRVMDAIFESASGFTTTGATVLGILEIQPRGILFWRSFTLWIGGMGVLVLTLALLPQMTGRTSFLMRAESPGPGLSKLVPKMGDMAKLLYLMYVVLTVLQALALLMAGMTPFDAMLHALGTAGTGGFSNYTANVGHFQNPWVEGITFAFMALFGVNFAMFYRALKGSWREVFRSEELRWYAAILLAATLAITLFLLPTYQSLGTSLRHSAFQVASMASTTGYTTANIGQWHQGARMILLLLMFIGACGGSTAGGLKVVRLATLIKAARGEAQHAFRPRKVQVLRMEGKAVDDSVVSQTLVFFFLYTGFILLGTFALSLENLFSFEDNLTAALAGVSNGGVVFSASAVVHDFAAYGWFSKLTLVFLMLLGRLEIFPVLVLFHPSLWRRS